MASQDVALLLIPHREEMQGRAYTPFTPRSHDYPRANQAVPE